MSHFTDIIAIHPYTAYRKGYFSNYKIYKKQIQYTMNFIRKGVSKISLSLLLKLGGVPATHLRVYQKKLKSNLLTMQYAMLKRLEYQQLSYTNLMMHQVIFMTQNQDLVWLNTTV